MISVADYVAKKLAEVGVNHVFMVTGGGAMFLNNAFGSEPRIKCIFNHHEQASAMAAEGYARVLNQIGVVNVTSGPGSINALNGVFGAWTDSIPMLVISGQSKRETLVSTYNLPDLRQLGDQEVDIIKMVRGITKYSVLITEPGSIRYHLEKALYQAKSGRPGPCWLDIPIDVQSSFVDENSLEPYLEDEAIFPSEEEILKKAQFVLQKIISSKRPVIIAGTGIRLSDSVEIFDRVIHKLGIPVTTAWTHDVIDSDDPLFCGRPGTIGTRAGNFVVQNADLVVIIGSRLNIRQVSFNWQSFAKDAYKIQIDIDPAELSKPTIKPDMGIQCDAKYFLRVLDEIIDLRTYDNSKEHKDWLVWCKERTVKYPSVTPAQRNFRGAINPYLFVEKLFSLLDEKDTVVCGNASACIIPFQVAKIKKGQRLFSNSGSASMGYDLPAAIGAAFAAFPNRVICIAGDGSLQMNIQEFQTLKHYQPDLKCFVINNNGYLSIRSSQKNFFNQLTGESPQSGITFPDIKKVAEAYGLPAFRLDSENFYDSLKMILALPGPVVCEVVVDPDQGFEPRMSSKQMPDGKIISPSLEDMYPFLSREELDENMISSHK